MQKIIPLLLAALAAVLFPVAASAQTTTPTTATPVAGVCGVAVNSCVSGALGNNAQQPDGSYQWYCSGVGGGTTSPLCFTAAVIPPPQPPATELLGIWVLDVEVGNIIDGITGSTRDFPQGDLPLQFTVTSGTSYPGSQQYSGTVDGATESNVDLSYNTPINGGQQTISLNVNYNVSATFGEASTYRWVNAQLTLLPGQAYGFGAIIGTVRNTDSPQTIDRWVTGKVNLYRQNCCKGDAGDDAGK